MTIVDIHQDKYWMQKAIDLAKEGGRQAEVPVGAILVHENQIVGRGHNECIRQNDPSAHAEILALRDAGKALNNYRLNETTLYVTLEPCLMCVGAILHARIKRLVFGALDPKAGVVLSRANLLSADWINHPIEFKEEVLAEPCKALLHDFFQACRLG